MMETFEEMREGVDQLDCLVEIAIQLKRIADTFEKATDVETY